MEIALAKEFMFFPDGIEHCSVCYVSRCLDDILQLDSYNNLWGVYGVVDTPAGEKLFLVERAYSGEYILTRVFLHKAYILNYIKGSKIIHL